ncbi:hypothetical protein K435DRAFT_857714 [Dendrothele bispora CBS 962.96]|uniref:Uncharacterized protein n=1 Tax=Dendrothele bispora (strain CBS 962.96) TaxID=1314807 RepID=A0A4S8M5H4_DENBC|nr:hypothetical protein K435DRAFT_857714 [Dendrothele bispora CBS 962.96]
MTLRDHTATRATSYYTDVILIFLFLVVLLRLSGALRDGRVGAGHQRRAAAAHLNYDIHHTASQDLSTDDTHVNCGPYQSHLGTKENPVPPFYSIVHLSSALFSTFPIVEPYLMYRCFIHTDTGAQRRRSSRLCLGLDYGTEWWDG